MNRNAERIALHQREGRAGHLQSIIASHGTDDRTRERALAHPKVTMQRDDVSSAEGNCEIFAELKRSRFVGEVQDDWSFACHHYSAAARIPSGASGNRQTTAVPRPSPVSISTVPPWSSTKLFTIESPSPAPRRRPPVLRDSNRLKMDRSTSGAMPGPLSWTRNTTPSPLSHAEIVTRPPSGA